MSLVRVCFYRCMSAAVLVAAVMAAATVHAGRRPVEFVDDAGAAIVLAAPPHRVVSLVPAITEILFAIGAGDALVGSTYHSTLPAGAEGVKPVGGFLAPSVGAIEALTADVVFYSTIQQSVVAPLQGAGQPQWINLETRSIEDSFRNIRLLGDILAQSEKAQQLVAQIRSQLQLIRQKTDRIPQSERVRVIRLMGRDRVMSPGDDAFQVEMIRAAGGIPPVLKKTGDVVVVSKEAWIAFNPQFTYGCGEDRESAETLLNRPGWENVDAVKNHRSHFFPCELTCRASTHTGDFVSWLSALLYADAFSDPASQIYPDAVGDRSPVRVDIPCVADARIVTSRIHDFINKSIVLDFDRPMRVVSTLEGFRSGIRTVGNHYLPPPTWHLDGSADLDTLRDTVYRTMGLNRSETAFLFTGADVDNVSIQHRSYRALTAAALVTAGVRGNAMRMSKDAGTYYEPGTINVILLTNTALSDRAMTRALITVTEAKTAALADLDIRSSYRPQHYGATGTGTDNIIVVGGGGVPIDTTGGHSKMGELMADAVYAGVIEAVARQNQMTAGRSIFHRLAERRIDPMGLPYVIPKGVSRSRTEMAVMLERALLAPDNAGFMEASLAISDARESKRDFNLSAFRAWCRQIAEANAGKKIEPYHDFLEGDLPRVLEMAINALLNGASAAD
ncbi:MAG: helical backbone metal receptor [Pseudomonadota bacterium]